MLLILFISFIFLGMSACENVRSSGVAESSDSVVTNKVSVVHKEFGIAVDSFKEIKGEIERHQYLANILLPYGVSYQKIAGIVKKSDSIFDVQDIRAGRPYTLFCSKDSAEEVKYFVYQPDEINYVVYDLTDSIHVYKNQLPVTKKEKTVSGVIDGSLYGALNDAPNGVQLAMKLGEVYAWDIDFYRIKKGDWFKILYEENYVKDKAIGVGRVKAAIFNHAGHHYYAFYFKGDSSEGYFDEHAQSLRKEFLKAPLKTYTITSHYTMRRFHPIQHRWKSHLGTDYAAPTGTPIMTTAAGVVIASRYTRFNGNYVKIRHNSVYTTQYLHMSKRAVHAGEHVDQGEVIGYVGSTGLATGPHVCYRFWKNGKQVDPYDQHFPPAEPVAESDKSAFMTLVKQEKLLLHKTAVDTVSRIRI